MKKAEMSDVPMIVRMALSFYEEAGYGDKYGVDPDMDSVISFASAFVLDADKVCFLVPNEGMIAGALIPWFFNNKKIAAQEMAWWVDPKFRKTLVSGRLFKAFEIWSKENGADILIMGSIPSLDGDRVNEFYRRKKLEPAESLFGRAI